MKNSPNVASASAEQAPEENNLFRFWASFIFCLIALGAIAGLILAGLFLLMGYHIF